MTVMPRAVDKAESAEKQARLISETLAGFAHDLAPAAIPAQVRERARHLMLDATGIAYASGRYEFAHKAMTAIAGLGGEGSVPVIGLPARLPPRDAALINGILVHGLDFDDTHTGGVIHATASLWPTVLATAYMRGASGAELLTAYVAGMEAATRLAAVGSGPFHQLGFHPTGLIGVFGCTLAAGTLMGLSPQALVMGQGIALSMASGSLEFLEDGAWTKRMHPGWAAQSGITAAALARQGFVGPSRAYEGRFGLFNAYLQAGIEPERWGRATAGLGEVWETMAVAVKPLPACHFTHACSDAALVLAKQHKFAVGDIERIKALVPAEVVKTVCEPVANKRRPANAYDAQFSIPYLVAASLVRGQLHAGRARARCADRRAHPAPVRPRRLRGRRALDLPAPLHRRGADLAEGRPQARASRGHEPRLRRPPALQRRHRRQVHRQRAHEPLGPAGRRGARRGARPRAGGGHASGDRSHLPGKPRSLVLCDQQTSRFASGASPRTPAGGTPARPPVFLVIQRRGVRGVSPRPGCRAEPYSRSELATERLVTLPCFP